MSLSQVYIVTFNVPYEGSDIEGVFQEYDSAVLYIKNSEAKLLENKEGKWITASGNYFEINTYQIL